MMLALLTREQVPSVLHVLLCVCVCVCVCMYVYLYPCVLSIYIRIFTHTHRQTDTHAHTHTHDTYAEQKRVSYMETRLAFRQKELSVKNAEAHTFSKVLLSAQTRFQSLHFARRSSRSKTGLCPDFVRRERAGEWEGWRDTSDTTRTRPPGWGRDGVFTPPGARYDQAPGGRELVEPVPDLQNIVSHVGQAPDPRECVQLYTHILKSPLTIHRGTHVLKRHGPPRQTT